MKSRRKIVQLEIETTLSNKVVRSFLADAIRAHRNDLVQRGKPLDGFEVLQTSVNDVERVAAP